MHGKPLYIISRPGLAISVGGNPDTSFWQGDGETAGGWVVVGIGLAKKDRLISVMTREDWGELLARKVVDVSSIDGHFVCLRWNHDQVEVFTDQLGLRTVYYSKLNGAVFVSTRLDWLARTVRRSEVETSSLGSRWLLFNQLSYDSSIQGIDRLGPGGNVIIRDGSVIAHPSTPWTPSFELQKFDDALDALRSLIHCALQLSYTPSLGLSGGMDSRLLLSLLASTANKFAAHTFGNPSNPDVQIAQQISEALGFPHMVFNDPLPEVQKCIDSMQSYAAQTCLTEPCTTFFRIRYYATLRESGKMLIDGGFGEIARRQYLNRVVRLGGSALKTRNVNRLFHLMRSPRGDIFTQDVMEQLADGARTSLEKTLVEMPPVENIGIENFADLLAVRTRVPNYGAPEQARLDGEVLNYMPLVQPSFLRLVFGIPAVERSNARLYQRSIELANVVLSRFPLVKSGLTYPFGLPTILAWLVTRVKSKMGNAAPDTGPDDVLAHLREYVFDVAHSVDTSTNPMYDMRKVVEAVTRYYSGESHLRTTVEWWLTFELWKRSLSSKSG